MINRKKNSINFKFVFFKIDDFYQLKIQIFQKKILLLIRSIIKIVAFVTNVLYVKILINV